MRQLPADVDDRHAMLVRRLLAEDASIDILSLDSAFTAEFAEAQVLAPIPEEFIAPYGKDIAPTALAAATYEEQLVAAPWWFDPQLLWYRGNTAERAGLDLTRPVTWDDLIGGAHRLGVTVQIEDRDGSGVADWVGALVAGGGGALVDGTGRGAKVGLDTEAARAAASVVEFYAESHVGPGPSAEALRAFMAPDGGFLVGGSAVITDPAIAVAATDLGWAPYPVVGSSSIAPLSGVALAVPLYAAHTDLSYQAISCLTSSSSMATLMTTTGHAASRLTTYDTPAVKAALPMAGGVRKAVETGRTVPSTPYWHLVRSAIDESWRPITEVTAADTPSRSQSLVRGRLAGDLR